MPELPSQLPRKRRSASPLSPSGGPRRVPFWLVVALFGGVGAFFVLQRPHDPPRPSTGLGGLAAAGGAAAHIAEPSQHCRALPKTTTFRIGEAGQTSEDEPQALVPFSVELGRASWVGERFAVGLRRQREGKPHAAVALFSHGEERIVELARSHGDMDAPLVVPTPEGWVAGMLESNASGYAVRLVTLRDDKLFWGDELPQGRDESMAFDMAFAKRLGVVTWDDVSDVTNRGVVVVATVKTKSLKQARAPKVVSSAKTDAELPRVVARPGGFWLAYLARAAVDDGRKRGSKFKGRYAGERIDPTWIELIPLNARGRAEGSPQAITPRDGHALAFDLQSTPDGGVLIAWRDDDTPSGAHGGKVTTIAVSASGTGQVQPVADQHVGAGVPSLLGHWLAFPDERGRYLLASLAVDGQLQEEPHREDILGLGLPLAEHEGEVLVATAIGKAIDLKIVSCAMPSQKTAATPSAALAPKATATPSAAPSQMPSAAPSAAPSH